MADRAEGPFEEDTACPRDHVVWTWVTSGRMLPGNSRGARRLRCKLCNKEYKGNRQRAAEHFILARASARCPGVNLSIWKGLHRIGAKLPPDLLERVRMALEHERDDDDDDIPNASGAGEEGGGGIADQLEEACGAEGEEGLDEGTRGVVTGGSAGGGRPASSQAVMQGAHARRTGRQTSIKRYVKNPRQEEIDDSCCEFFVENAIPFNAAKSRSFKKFTRACYGPQHATNHPLVPTGYNPLRCRLLDRLNKRLEEEEQVIRDDWEAGRSLFSSSARMSVRGNKDSAAVVAGWKRFFREVGVEKITTICTDSFAGNTSAAKMLREDPEFSQIYWLPCTAHCMDLLLHNICKKERAAEIISKANRVVNFFRVHRWPISALRTALVKFPDLKCSCLLRPAQTRFGMHYVMLQRLEVCEKAIRRIVTGQEWEVQVWRGDIRAKAFFVEETVLDRVFWTDVRKLAAVMKKPYNVLREVDKDVHCLSRIYDMACRLPGFVRSAPISAEQREDILRDTGNRTDMLLSPIHAVARLLDPQLRDITVFSNVDLMTQFESVVERLIGKKGSTRFDDCMDQLYDFQFGRGVLGTPQAKKRAAKDIAVLWWEAHGAGHLEIRELATGVLSIWTTSSPAERNWSTWALVQMKCRNKLHHQRTNKLVYSHWSLRLKSRGEDGPTIAGGWLGLSADWEDEDLEGDMANVTEAVDDHEPAIGGAGSAVGSTTVRHDRAGPSTSRSVQRLGHAEEVDEEEDEGEDVEDEDEEEEEEEEEHIPDSDRL
ncbi:hypothetical protein CBR_g37893 [Chara braunii]|uniref:DUF659 domain-containing protein n=1 Tax=Chara braunii TaxID=69332 RepID=A0A388LNX6_CHABU|nr:hypothetical protein CBR_g37893 [Chara braunii]|eukprot:GBG84018.1 hypothetical protein CBR_g37893 [Chara braunii]